MAEPRDPTGPRPDAIDADALTVPGGVPAVVWLAPPNPRWLLVACRTLLRHDSGVLAVAVRVPAPQRLSHLSALTGAARAVGLRDVRHVAAFDPATSPERGHRRAPATPAEPDRDADTT